MSALEQDHTRTTGVSQRLAEAKPMAPTARNRIPMFPDEPFRRARSARREVCLRNALRRAQRRRKYDCFVTCAEGAREQIPLSRGFEPLSFAYFSLRRQRKVGAAPHRGNANKPLRKQGKANTIRAQPKSAAQAKNLTSSGLHPATPPNA
jgi:hypothetical protein